MSEKALERIEKALTRLGEQQAEICSRIEHLEQRLGNGSAGGATREETIRFLDGFRAGEALGEAGFGAWIEVCQTACLRGGLRTIQAREGSHARLLENRIKELGGSASYEMPEAAYDYLVKGLGRRDRSDAEKLRGIMERFADFENGVAGLEKFADRLDGDQETQFLLRSIAQDEHSTLSFIQQACALLNPS